MQLCAPHFCFVAIENRLSSLLVAVCTYVMARFSDASLFLYRVDEHTWGQLAKLIAILLAIPCFELSHFFFKLGYAVNQRRLLKLCGDDFFLKFYDRPVANGRIVDVLQSLRHIEHGLEEAKASDKFRRHFFPPAETGQSKRLLARFYQSAHR